MRVKSYYSATVEEAIGLARRELGEEALLLATRPAPPEARHLGSFEVVFGEPGGFATGSIPERSGEGIRRDGAGRSAARQSRPEWQKDGTDSQGVDCYAEAREHVSGFGLRAIGGQGYAGPIKSHGVLDSLIDAGLSEDLAADIARNLDTSNPGTAWRSALAEQIGRRIETKPELGRTATLRSKGFGAGTRRVAAVVGPPGAGKTSTLIKLAVQYGLTAKRPTLLISMDNLRVAAGEQLRSLAAIIGAGFVHVETPRALAQALEENPRKDLVLIDTPGYGPGEMDSAGDAARFLATHPEIDTHLVLPAPMKGRDLEAASKRFQMFRPAKLIFTHLDETVSPGTAWNEAARSGVPISFLAAGQRIPEDLEEATSSRLGELLARRLEQGFGEMEPRTRSAAV